jgi:hypothetical protein
MALSRFVECQLGDGRRYRPACAGTPGRGLAVPMLATRPTANHSQWCAFLWNDLDGSPVSIRLEIGDAKYYGNLAPLPVEIAGAFAPLAALLYAADAADVP